MNRKLFPEATVAQTNGLEAGGVQLTLSILSSNRVPGPPDSPVTPSSEVPMKRSVLIGPGPGRMAPETVQPTAVSPALCTGVAATKVTTVESKVKSPVKPMYCCGPPIVMGSMSVVVTG